MWRACNAENLTSYLLTVEKLIRYYDIDGSRNGNLNETGCTPGKDTAVTSSKDVYTRSKARHEVREPIFKYVDRITFLSVIIANGTAGRPMFVFKGQQTRTTTVRLSSGVTETRRVADRLPRRSIRTRREDGASVGSRNFLQFAKPFVQDVAGMTSNEGKVILMYESYRSHWIQSAAGVRR